MRTAVAAYRDGSGIIFSTKHLGARRPQQVFGKTGDQVITVLAQEKSQ